MHDDTLPILSVEQLDKLCAGLIEEIKAQQESYEEGIAICSPEDDGKTTDLRALEALRRAERFAGEHQVAKAWLMNSKTASIWSKNGGGQ